MSPPIHVRNLWLDVDPGHDDAVAILLAIHCINIRLLGVSTTHGNANSDCTALNAARCLQGFAAPEHIRVYPGASQPLIFPASHEPKIHGEDGLGGVEGLPDAGDASVIARFAKHSDGSTIRALEGMVSHIKSTWDEGRGSKVTIASCGPMTNIALFVSVYPDLLTAVEEFIFMGGGVGLGNRSAAAEYNIVCDPHAAQIVLNVPVPKTMVPINVTHTAILTKEVHSRLLSPGSGPLVGDVLPKASTPLRYTLSTIMTFFAEAYKSSFGFNDGPPLHDALTVAYLSRPDLFKVERHRVDIELTGTHTMGETVVDIWSYIPCDDTWGRNGKNCNVMQSVDVNGFFELFLECVSRCENPESVIVPK